jgi:plasmid maintenance system antidote protein VapI
MSRKAPLLPPAHPGQILRGDVMVPRGLSINRLARDVHPQEAAENRQIEVPA